MSLFSLMMWTIALISGLAMLWKVPLIGRSKVSDPQATPMTVSVIIPARNEEHRLSPLLKSLAGQDYRPLEILVVDDHSSDGTARVARQGGATVVAAAEISEGWIGKTRACWSGAQAASGDILVFLDADTRLDHPDSFCRLLNAYNQTGANGMLSVQPYHTVKRLYESFSAIFNIILMAGMNRFTIFGKRLKGAGAFGPCIICRRADYFSTGGHEAVRGAVLDDLAIGQLFQNQSLPVNCFAGRGVISFRMYAENFGQLVEGWTKNFGSAATVTHPLIIVMLIFWIGAGLSTPLDFLQAIVSGEPLRIILYALACLAFMLEMFWLARQFGNFHPLLLVLYPVQFYFFLILFAWSLFRCKVLHSVRWRGRKIKV